MRRLFLLLSLPLAVAYCTVDPLELEGKACPCGDGYVCVDGACRKLASGPGDAGVTDADAAPEAAADTATPDADAGADAAPGCETPEIRKVPTMASGRRHTCVIRDGELWCWGDNEFGQLGVGDQVQRSLPERVGTDSDWITISAGTGHTCGIRSSNDVGNVYCWGHNEVGQLGIGVGEEVEPLPTIVSHNIQFRSIAAGDFHTCGLDENGKLWCWGRQAGGAVGLGNLGDPMTSPARVSEVDTYVDLSAGAGHNCAVRDNGTLWCWGHYECFQVGSETHPIRPRQVDDQCWKGVSAGSTHTCALRNDDTLQCFGSNGRGELGMGTLGADTDAACEAYATPLVVAGGHRWAAVAGGTIHTLGITSDGALYGWGYNEQKQVADIVDTGVPAPLQMGTETDWVEATGGFFHTCARNTGGEIYCRGLNDDGQQGNGSFNKNLKLVTF